MKRFMLYMCILLISLSLTGCGWFSNNKNNNQSDLTDVPSTPTQNGTTNNNTGNQSTGTMYQSVSDYMTALKNGGLMYTNEKEITDFNFAAHEGKEFMMDNQTFYLYRVNSSKSDIQKMLDEIDQNGYVTTTQDGTEMKKYAHRMGDFVLIYPEGYDIQKIDKILNNKV